MTTTAPISTIDIPGVERSVPAEIMHREILISRDAWGRITFLAPYADLPRRPSGYTSLAAWDESSVSKLRVAIATKADLTGLDYDALVVEVYLHDAEDPAFILHASNGAVALS